MVTRDGELVQLSRTEWLLLQHLAANAGKVVLHTELLTKVWGPEYRDDLQYLRVWVSRVRRKLGSEPGEPGRIKTFQGIGYLLDVEPPAAPTWRRRASPSIGTTAAAGAVEHGPRWSTADLAGRRGRHHDGGPSRPSVGLDRRRPTSPGIARRADARLGRPPALRSGHAAIPARDRAHRRRRAERLRRPGRRAERGRRRRDRPDGQRRDRHGREATAPWSSPPRTGTPSPRPISRRTAASGRSTASRTRGARSSTRT